MASDNEGRGGKRHNEGKGVLFTNKDEHPHPKAPGYRGRCTLAGVEYQISAWVQTAGENAQNPGEKYLQLKFEEKQYENQGRLSGDF
jgi:hypothetical protein